MIDRQLILQAWQRRNQNRSASPQQKRAQEFFNLVANPDLCWPELIDEFRRNYYDAYDEIVPTLLDTDDASVIYQSMRAANLANPKEADTVKSVISGRDSAKHHISLHYLSRFSELHPTLLQQKNLPDSLRDAIKGPKPKSKKSS